MKNVGRFLCLDKAKGGFTRETDERGPISTGLQKSPHLTKRCAHVSWYRVGGQADPASLAKGRAVSICIYGEKQFGSIIAVGAYTFNPAGYFRFAG